MSQIKEKQNIPKGWQVGKLGDFIIDIKDGGTPSRHKKEYFRGDIPWVVIKDIRPRIKTTSESLSQAGLENSSAKLFSAGTIILSFGATIGEVGIAEVNLATKQGIAGISYDKERINSEYLYFLLQSLKQCLNQLASGSTIKEVRPTVIKNINVLVPSLTEQRKIAEILGVVDEQIQKTDEIISATEKLKHGLMQQLFTRGIGHTRFKKTPIGEIPIEWDIVKIKDPPIKLIDGDRGVNYPKQKDFSSGGYCLFLNNKNIKGDRFVFSDLQFIEREKDEALRKGKLQRGDVVLTTRGTVGNVAYYDNAITFENIRINSGMLILRAFAGMEERFLYHLMKSPQLKQKYLEVASGSAQPQLPIRNLEHIYIPLPPEDEQLKIVEISDSIDLKLSINKTVKEKLVLLKKGLMQDLLNGKKRV